ncbi:hypothetical protein B0T13DRAFT_90343 [Neurospora crassa]|nr:hypothetical protein B0T13DRAFT_90343 [Neurospora crassa]
MKRAVTGFCKSSMAVPVFKVAMRRTPTVYQSGERDASHKLPCSFLSVSSQPVSIRLTSLSCQGERGCLALPAALRRSEWRMVWWSCRREPRKTESTPGPQVHDSIDGDVLHPGNKKPRRRRQYIYRGSVHSGVPSSAVVISPPLQISFHRRCRPHHCKRGVGCHRHHDLHTYHHRRGVQRIASRATRENARESAEEQPSSL